MSFAPTPQISTRTALLLDMLTYKRPAGSDTERLFIEKFITPLGAQPDGYGNLWLDVGPADPEVLFSSHTDTVHHTDGFQEIDNHLGMIRAVVTKVAVPRTPHELEYDLEVFAKTGIMPKQRREKSTNCLGADCTTGVWIMIQLINAGVPGRYVFHIEEEIGGHGSSYVSRKEPERLKGIRFAIAFDRKGYYDVITHQFGGRCCSNAFAWSLAGIIDMGHKPDDTGSFTDTANYTDLVPECTNLSVGYFGQHGPKEEQDLDYVELLTDRLIAADWSLLVESRDPTAYPASRWDWEDEDEGSWSPKSNDVPNLTTDELALIKVFREHPADVANWMLQNGFDAATLLEEMEIY